MVDLIVETALLRRAADVVADAAAAICGIESSVGSGYAAGAGGSPGGNGYPVGPDHPGDGCPQCPLSDASLGRSAAGREAVEAASRRVFQAVQATRMLAALVSGTAEALRITANAFDAAESPALGPPR